MKRLVTLIASLLALFVASNAQNIIAGPDDGPSMFLVVGGTLNRPTVTNVSNQPVIAYAIRRHTDGRSTTFHETQGLRPGQTKNLGLLMTWGHPDDGNTLDYQITGVILADGRSFGDESERLKGTFWGGLRPGEHAGRMTPLDRGAYGPYKAGTPTWGYSGDANVAEQVPPGLSSTVASNYAFCFSGPVTAFGYKIAGGLIQNNQSAPCGPLNAFLTAVQVSFRADGQFDQLRQQGKTYAAFGSVFPSAVTQFEGCDYAGDDGVVGDYLITTENPGECYDPTQFGAPSESTF